MPPDDAPVPPPESRRTARRFWLVTLGGGLAMFGAWCVADVLYVHAGVRGSDGWLLLLPAATALATGPFFPGLPAHRRIGLCFAAAALASVLALVLFLFLGFGFHAWIGGRI